MTKQKLEKEREAEYTPIGFKTQSGGNQLPNSSGKLHKMVRMEEEEITSNLYFDALCKAFKEFLKEEAANNSNSERRFLKKIEAARLLFKD